MMITAVQFLSPVRINGDYVDSVRHAVDGTVLSETGDGFSLIVARGDREWLVPRHNCVIERARVAPAAPPTVAAVTIADPYDRGAMPAFALDATPKRGPGRPRKNPPPDGGTDGGMV